jgi:L-ascorbate metabolism protein UlaG (beta-lactamase superfamily)
MASIKITLLGHASMKLEPDSGEVFFFDAWLDENPTCDLTVDTVERADVVIASHGHNDHIGDSFAICQKTGATFVGNYELCVVAEKHGLEMGNNAIPMNPGGTVDVKGARVTATQAFHSLSMSPSLTLGAPPDDHYFHPDGAVCGMVMAFDNGITVYNTADTTVFSDMQLISQMHGPQIAILPVGGLYTMGIREAARAASFVRPDLVIPCHYGETLGQPADIAALSEAVSFLSPNTQVVALDPGQSATYHTSSFEVNT